MAASDKLLDRGLELHQGGQLAEAAQIYQAVLQDSPRHADAAHLFGLVKHQQANHEEALRYIQRALEIKPRTEVYLTNLGAIFHALERYTEAADIARTVLQLNPNSAKAHFNLGCSLHKLEQLDAAVHHFKRAVEIDPQAAEAHVNLGNTLNRLGKFDEAIDHYKAALAIDPRCSDTHRSLGESLRQQGRLEEAAQSLQQALKISPHSAELHQNLGLTLLRMGDFAAGWAHYEWRWQTRTFKPRNFDAPLWDGRAAQGSTILIHAEQGFGDTIQFVRYAPLVQALGLRVVLECQKSLQTLLANSVGIDRLVARGSALPAYDFHIPLLSLPHRLGTNAETIPSAIPYLSARADLIDLWRDRLGDCRGLKVGICWQGNTKHSDDRRRSLALSEFEALASIPGVDLISLQKGYGVQQLAEVRFQVRTLSPDVDHSNWSFMDTAAVIRNLDLVISADTSVAHLAGALGVPVWVALPKMPDWRWQLGRSDSPWYPTMRLFRQETAGDWKGVFQHMRHALREGSARAGKGL